MSTGSCDSSLVGTNASAGKMGPKSELVEEGKRGPMGTVVPWPGSTFIIRQRASGRVISILNGDLTLQDWESNGDRASHFQCETSEGWLVFRNPISGTCIGHAGTHSSVYPNNFGYFTSNHQLDGFSKSLVPMRCPGGGYLLLAHQKGWLVKMNAVKTNDGTRFSGSMKEGTVWEFIQI